MRFELTPEQRTLAGEVDRVLDSAPGSADPRELLARLGRERLLAVHYPVRYGGRGLGTAAQGAVAERLGERGLPDEVHLVTVQGVGCSILAHGTERQRAAFLPAIAEGALFASLLLSEVEAGSDVARIRTRAVPDGEGWRLTGAKSWNLRADWSGLGLCSARTRDSGNRYDGVTLFLVRIDSPGVRVEAVSRAIAEPYFTVTLDDVRVGAESVLGVVHGGIPLLMEAIGYERAGFDYLARATTWLAAARHEVRLLPEPVRAQLAPDLVRFEQANAAARVLAYHAANSARELRMDELVSAYSKLACGDAAQAVARWVGTELVPRLGQDRAAAVARLRAAIAEAPELSISGGAFELQLDLIANEALIGRAVR